MSGTLLAAWEGARVDDLAAQWDVPHLEVFATIGSTNDRAAEIAAGQGAPYAVVLAEEQSRGRGRRGRPWAADRGDALLMSITLPSWDGPPSGHVPLLVGLAVAEAVESVAPDVEVGIKWPNDLWLADRKVGGVLVEAGASGSVAGVGLNVRGVPTLPDGGALPEATCLAEHTSVPLSRRVLAGALLATLRRRLGEGTGAPPRRVPPLTEPARAAIAARDVLRGRSVESETAGRGVAEGLDEDGALFVRSSDGTLHRVVAGSVRLR